ncbi:MAG: thioredoxin-like domain-containing protein [Bacteroidota bacterium]
MKILITNLLITISLLLLTVSTNAQIGKNNILLKKRHKYALVPPSISGVIHYKSKVKPVTFGIIVFDENNTSGTEAFDLPTKVTRNSTFSFQLPIISRPKLIQIQSFKSSDFISTIGQFFVEPNDKIKIEIFETSGEDSIVFSGESSAKYLVSKILIDDFKDFYAMERVVQPPAMSDLESIDSFTNYLNYYTSVAYKLFLKGEKLIFSNPEINSKMKLLLKSQYLGFNAIWALTMNNFYVQACTGNAVYMQAVQKCFNDNFPKLLIEPNMESFASPRFSSYLEVMLAQKLVLNSESGDVPLKNFYNLLKSNYTGEIRERQMIQFIKEDQVKKFFVNIEKDTIDSLIEDSKNYLISDKGKEIYKDVQFFKRGTQIFDGEFIDTNGNKFTTASLRGKVVLIDIWGTGCKGCAYFYKRFEQELWPTLKQNKKFRYLSVNTDMKQSTWLTSLESDLYSSKEYLNVFTGQNIGLYKHPFTKFYQINAAPFLLLVDEKGQVISRLTVDVGMSNLAGEIISYTNLIK